MRPWQRRKSELDEEIAAHIEMAVADRVAAGEAHEAARQAVLREFGNSGLVKDTVRSTWGWQWAESLLEDIRYAVRVLRKAPAFTITVVGTLMLGIAAAAAMFTVVDKVLLRPLPFQSPGTLVVIQEARSNATRGWDATWLDVQEWRRWNHGLADIAVFRPVSGRNFLDAGGLSTQVTVSGVSSNLFSLLGVQPRLGRGFDGTDVFATTADTQSILLGDHLWRTALHADPHALGRTVLLSGKPRIVAGVMPPGFSFPFQAYGFNQSLDQAWLPIELSAADGVRSNDSPQYEAIGRLKPRVGVAAAAADLNTLQAQVVKGYSDPEARDSHAKVLVTSYAETLVEAGTRKALGALLAASGLLWLIACANATNLMLARTSARERELAVRGALGAGSLRIAQQMLVEGLLLSGAATLLGTGIAWISVRMLARSLNRILPLPVDAAPSPTLLLGLASLTLLSALTAAAWPGWKASHAPIEPALRQGGQQSGITRADRRLRSALVVTEIALSLTLLASCGLLLRTLYALRHVPLGFRTDHILVANLAIPGYQFAGRSLTSDLYLPLLERVQHMPGVQSAGLMNEVPLGRTFTMSLTLYDGKMKDVQSLFQGVTPSIQQVYGFTVLRGRYFRAQDTAGSEPVVVVNRAFARSFAPTEQDPGKVIGKQLLSLKKGGNHATIVGVVDDTRQATIAQPSHPEVQVSLAQITPESGFYMAMEGIAMDLAVRTEQRPESMIASLRAVLRQASPALANSNFTTMDEVVEDSFGSQRLAAHLLEIFAGTALLLSVAGLYGLLA